MLATAVFLGDIAACVSGPRSPVGFRLPEGDAKRGQETFLELQCYSCHTVVGVDLPSPSPSIDAPVPVILGGELFEVRTDGYLVTSIIHPSHKLAHSYPREQIAKSSFESRMSDYSDVMTVRQLIDLVAFLQSRYKYVPLPVKVFSISVLKSIPGWSGCDQLFDGIIRRSIQEVPI